MYPARRRIPTLRFAGVAAVWTAFAMSASLNGPAAADVLAGLTVAPEHRCSPYSRSDYPYPQSIEIEIVAAQGGRVYGPYTGRFFRSTSDTDIEHIVSVSEAHDSGSVLPAPPPVVRDRPSQPDPRDKPVRAWGQVRSRCPARFSIRSDVRHRCVACFGMTTAMNSRITCEEARRYGIAPCFQTAARPSGLSVHVRPGRRRRSLRVASRAAFRRGNTDARVFAGKARYL